MKIVLNADTAIHIRFVCQRKGNDGSGNDENGGTTDIGEDNMPIISRDGEYGEMADSGEGNGAETSREDELDGTTEDGTSRTMPSAIC